MSIHETIIYLNDKIAEIKTYADMRAYDMPENIKERITAQAERLIDLIEQVIVKVEKAALTVQYDNLNFFLRDVIVKCDGAVTYTRRKIDEVVSLEENNYRLKEVRQHIRSAMNEIRANEEVQEILGLIKEVTSSIYNQVEYFMSLPDAETDMTEAKVSTVKMAEKGVVILKKLLSVSDEDF